MSVRRPSRSNTVILKQLTLIPSQASPPDDLVHALEAVLFASGEPIRIQDTARSLGVRTAVIRAALFQLSAEYDEGKRGICVMVFGDSAQMCTRSDYSDAVKRTLQPLQRRALSHHVLETLAVVAYNQPVTRGEIDQVRGVKSDSSVQTLLARGLIRELGRRDTLGRPMEFGTTDLFLRHFGLTALRDLPTTPDEKERMSI